MLFKSYNREKLINAIIYFTRATKYCHTLKLFKLLFFLDFEHYRQTGRGVTGLTYKAWPNGPAPSELWHELSAPRPDLASAVAVWTVRDDLTDAALRRDIRAKHQFDSQYFSKREMAIMERLALYFKETRGDDMSEFSHVREMPWSKVYQGGKGNGRLIPYDLSVSSKSIIADMPTIDLEDLEFKKSALAEVREHTNGGGA